MIAPSTIHQTTPGHWTLPAMPGGGSAGLRQVAAEWRELAALLTARAEEATGEIDRLRASWHGAASTAAPLPLRQLQRDTTTVRRALHQGADELDRLAAATDKAQDDHHWSWRKAAALGAIVVVTAAAVTVTVASAGAAAPAAVLAEEVAVGAAVAEIAAASATALAARAAAARALLAVAQMTRLVRVVRLDIIRPLLLSTYRAPIYFETPLGVALISGGSTAALDAADGEGDGVDWTGVALSSLLGAIEGNVGASTIGMRNRTIPPWRLLAMKLPHVRTDLTARATATTTQHDRPFAAPGKQLQSHYEHAEILGLPVNYSKKNAGAYESALKAHLASGRTIKFPITFRGKPRTAYADYDSRITMLCLPDGTFETVMQLKPIPHYHLWRHHKLGGS